MSDENHPKQLTDTRPNSAGHGRHCFIVMPFGRTPAEARWFRGWYDVVIKSAVLSAAYEPKLTSAEEQPSAINDDIRAHLAFDPMVVVDLGGVTPEAEPNANVMYELGIRHALGLPLVMLAWKGQRLPFDVGNQRVIMEGRELLDLEMNRQKLIAFIKAAAAGQYYRPMDAVGRVASLDLASAALGEDSLMAALVHEIRDLRQTVMASTHHRGAKPYRSQTPNVKRFLAGKVFRKELYPYFMEHGGTGKQWAQLLKSQLPPEILDQAAEWDVDGWKTFIAEQAKEWRAMAPAMSDLNSPTVPVEKVWTVARYLAARLPSGTSLSDDTVNEIASMLIQNDKPEAIRKLYEETGLDQKLANDILTQVNVVRHKDELLRSDRGE